MSRLIQCSCGKQIQIQADDPSARIRCPVCQDVLDVPGRSEEGAGGYALESVRICPRCRKSWPGDAAICVDCGHDFRSGKKHETTYQLRPRSLVLGLTFLGTYRLYTLQRNRKGQPTFTIKSWLLWIPLGTRTIELKDYDSVVTDWYLHDTGRSQTDVFMLELHGPRKRPWCFWRGTDERSMHALVDMLQEGAGLTVKRK
jgi:hypothetical protein